VQLLQSSTNFVSTDEVTFAKLRGAIEDWLLFKVACERLVGWRLILAGHACYEQTVGIAVSGLLVFIDNFLLFTHESAFKGGALELRLYQG
jgi:hypothetical protein